MLRALFRKSLQPGLICVLSALLAAQPVFAWTGPEPGPETGPETGSETGNSAGLWSSSADGIPSGDALADGAGAAADGAAVEGAPLQIDILDGEGALNNIRARTAREPIVQVTDRNHKPVAGALVIFAIQPGSPSGALHRAASASFHGAKTVRVQTDANGRATGRGLTPNGQVGSFVIEVTAIADGVTATALIHEQNFVGPGANSSSGHGFLGTHAHLLTWIGAGTVVVATTVITLVVVNGNSSTSIATGAGTVGKP